MFITRPRPKKNTLSAPPRKKRKADFAIDEISFDDTARSDYLTGFHKRKVQRQKLAQDAANEKARLERIAFRKDLREQRQRDVEEHVKQVNDALRQARLAGGEQVTESENEEEGTDGEWGGIKDSPTAPPVPEFVDHEEEYIDEDRYTTVTVEAVDIDRDGMHALSGRHTSDSEGSEAEDDDDGTEAKKNKMGQEKDGKNADAKMKIWPKKHKKKFRYESKMERQVSRLKQNKKR